MECDILVFSILLLYCNRCRAPDCFLGGHFDRSEKVTRAKGLRDFYKMTMRYPFRQYEVKPGRPGRVWFAAFVIAFMMAGAAMAQGGMSESTERLFDAVFKNDMTGVKSSIPAGANLDALNSWGQTPADLAVDLGYFEIAHFLTSLRQFEKREKEETPPLAASNFPPPQFSPPSAPAPQSPSFPAPALAPEPTPPPLPGGAFDPAIASQGSVLSVIGDIRGPQGSVPPEAIPPSPAPSPLPDAGVAAKPVIKRIPPPAPKPALPPAPAPPVAAVQPPPPAPTVAAVQPPPPAQPVAAVQPPPPAPPVAAVQPPPPAPTVAAVQPPPPAPTVAAVQPPPPAQPVDAVQPPPPAPTVAAVQPPPPVQVPASSAEPVASPAIKTPGFISNLWGQLADAFSEEPEEIAEPEPEDEDEEYESISDMLGQLKDSFSAVPDGEGTKDSVVFFGQAKPSMEESPVEGAAVAVEEIPVQPAPSPAPVEIAAEPPAQPTDSASSVETAPGDEEYESISDMLGQLKESFSAVPDGEGTKEPVVAFGQANPSVEVPPVEGAAVAVDEIPVQPAPSPAPVETAAEPPAQPTDSASSVDTASGEEEFESISDMLGQLKKSFSATPGGESTKEPAVAFGQAKSSPEESPVERPAKSPEPEVAAAEPAEKEAEAKPKFYDRLSKFLSLDSYTPPRVKKRKRARLNTETAMIRFPKPARPTEFLKNVALNLSGAPDLGKPAPSVETCILKNRGRVAFCIEPVDWPESVRPLFQVNTYMYSGAKSIVRYDDGKATFVHVLFPSASFQDVVDHFNRRFGPPTDQRELWLTSLSSPARTNALAAWWSIEGDGVTSLQIRTYDDTRGGFPDMEYGAISLHIQGAKPIFPLLSTANLMLLKFKRSP